MQGVYWLLLQQARAIAVIIASSWKYIIQSPRRVRRSLLRASRPSLRACRVRRPLNLIGLRLRLRPWRRLWRIWRATLTDRFGSWPEPFIFASGRCYPHPVAGHRVATQAAISQLSRGPGHDRLGVAWPLYLAERFRGNHRHFDCLCFCRGQNGVPRFRDRAKRRLADNHP